MGGIANRDIPCGNFRKPDLPKLLIESGLPVDVLDKDGYSLLYHAADSAVAVLNAGTEVNRVCEDVYQSTALHCAARLGRLEAVELLLANGADASIKDAYGRNALDMMEQGGPDSNRIQALLKSAIGG